MKLLLDTHILLWAAASPEKISEKGRLLLLPCMRPGHSRAR